MNLKLCRILIFIYFVYPPASSPETEFLNLLRSPGIDSQLGGKVRQPYLTAGQATHRLAESIPGLLIRLQIRAQQKSWHIQTATGPCDIHFQLSFGKIHFQLLKNLSDLSGIKWDFVLNMLRPNSERGSISQCAVKSCFKTGLQISLSRSLT
jgi:hypothetical protein